MNRTKLQAGLCAAAMITTLGCEKDPGTTGQDEVTASDVRREAGQAAESATEYASQTLSEYREAMNERVDALNEDISSLSSKAETLAGDAKTEAEESIETLRTKRDAFVERLNGTAEDSQAAWSDLKAGLDSAWQELDEARKTAMDRFGG